MDFESNEYFMENYIIKKSLNFYQKYFEQDFLKEANNYYLNLIDSLKCIDERNLSETLLKM